MQNIAKRTIGKIVSLFITAAILLGLVAGFPVSDLTRAQAVTDGLVSHYDFSNGSGTELQNKVAAGQHASWQTGVANTYKGIAAEANLPRITTTEEGITNGGAFIPNNAFSVADAYALSDVEGDFSIQVRLKFNTRGDWRQITNIAPYYDRNRENSKRNYVLLSTRGDNQGLGFEFANKISGSIGENNSFTNTGSSFNNSNLDALNGQWATLTVVREGSATKIFVNGEQKATGNSKDFDLAGIFNERTTGDPIFISIATALCWNDDGVDAIFDDYRIYGRALPAVEIETAHAAFNANNLAVLNNDNLVYWYDFSTFEADGHTIKNKVDGFPGTDLKVTVAGENTWVDGTDGALYGTALQLEEKYRPQIYAPIDDIKELEDMTISTLARFDGNGQMFFLSAGSFEGRDGGAENPGNKFDNNIIAKVNFDGGVEFEIKNGNAARVVRTSVNSIAKGKYINIVFTLEGRIARIYIDGKLYKETTWDANGTANVNMKNMNYTHSADYLLNIGGNSIYKYGPNFYEEGMKGTMQDMRFYNKALTAAEVDSLYKSFVDTTAEADKSKLNILPDDVLYAFEFGTDGRGRTIHNADGSVTGGSSAHYIHNAYTRPMDINDNATYYLKSYVRNGFDGEGDDSDTPAGGGYLDGWEGQAPWVDPPEAEHSGRFGSYIQGGQWMANKYLQVTYAIKGDRLKQIVAGENGAQFRLGYLKGGGAFEADSEHPITVYRQFYVSTTSTLLPDHPANLVIDMIEALGATPSQDDVAAINSVIATMDHMDINEFAIPNLSKFMEIMNNFVTVEFDTNGGTSATPATQTITRGQFATKPATDPTRANFRFNGWFTAATGGQEWNFATNPVNENITLFARWTQIPPPAVTWTVTFRDGNSILKTPAAHRVANNATVTRPANPRKSGHKFVDWFTTNTGNTKFRFGANGHRITKNTLVYARFVKIPAKPAKFTATRSGTRKARLRWTKQTGVIMEVRYRRSGASKWTTRKTKAGASSWTSPNLTRKRTFQFQVRGRRTKNGVLATGSWTSTKRVSIK